MGGQRPDRAEVEAFRYQLTAVQNQLPSGTNPCESLHLELSQSLEALFRVAITYRIEQAHA